ncbi:ABC transporter substrate-binding protein [Actinomadura sp. ATCC 31491]|uniref:ABC transporter substrate-binding protein n=1 Tax=Actinomadura luzonensis TaxID=2805427 RepID=A0ABT0G2N4_9ACTN|nr:ABC transporter substrate-binding protein [Actinomadura luzonensis]MCK2218445.1 ABC transporter substrate-binding protein [Actinomadura luzonensis]
MRPRALPTFAALLGTLTLAACGGGGAAQAPKADAAATPEFSGTLSILTKFAGDPTGPYFEKLTAAYAKQHPQVKFELIQETDQSVKDKLKTLTASDALPDIYFTWTGNWADNYIRGGRAADLSAVIGPDTAWGKTFSPGSLAAFARDGKYYGIPLYGNGKFMGYSKSAFAKAGVEVPRTFEELVAACGPLRKAGYEPVAFGNKDGWPALHYLQQLFAYNVPDATLQADFDPATAKLDDPGYVTALNQFKTLVDQCTDTREGTNGVLYSSAQEAFAGGKAAMYYQEILEFDNATSDKVKPDDFGIFQLPVPRNAPGDGAVLEGSPEGYLVNARSPRVALAVDFMKFVTSQENARTLSAPPYGQPSTVVGAVTPETSSKAVYEGVQLVNKAPKLAIWLDTVTVPEVADAWLAGGEALISGGTTAEKVLESVRQASESAK